MFTRYATNKEICEVLAAYKVGDTVTVLRKTETNKGVISAGAIGIISDIRISRKVFVPAIISGQQENYYANSDADVFEYKVTLADSEDIKLFLTSKEIEKGILPAENINACIKEKKRERFPILAKGCLKRFPVLLIYLCTVFAAMFMAKSLLSELAVSKSTADTVFLIMTSSILVPMAICMWIETSINLFGVGRIKRKR